MGIKKARCFTLTSCPFTVFDLIRDKTRGRVFLRSRDKFRE